MNPKQHNVGNVTETECGEHMEILHGILLVPQNTVIDLNKVMNRLALMKTYIQMINLQPSK